ECLTEPGGGSDVFGASTVALDKGDHFLLTGQKRFIVGGEGADFFVVYALTDLRPEAKSQQALTCLIVDRGCGGVETKYLYSTLGCRGGGLARLEFRDVVVPKANVLGEVNGAHNVMSTMMIPARLGAAATTLGTSRVALDL
ncbi:MAG: acyl-CoA dehydrogenase, partial [Deltaproteobacteria bacterium]|nr:acyl-CoA dehydrogenase [Deltaproteobacteria bacterium]